MDAYHQSMVMAWLHAGWFKASEGTPRDSSRWCSKASHLSRWMAEIGEELGVDIEGIENARRHQSLIAIHEYEVIAQVLKERIERGEDIGWRFVNPCPPIDYQGRCFHPSQGKPPSDLIKSAPPSAT